MVDNQNIDALCGHCDKRYTPDADSRGAWVCPACSKKNPNLRRHYRSVADLCILGLIATARIGARIGDGPKDNT